MPFDARSRASSQAHPPASLIDRFGRKVDYLRLSVTDRCDLRCTYCMAERMTFLPRRELLTIEELVNLTSAFIDLGVQKVRLTGGEPLVRHGITALIEQLGQQVARGRLRELTLTTNGTSWPATPPFWPTMACGGSMSRWTRSTRPNSPKSPASGGWNRC